MMSRKISIFLILFLITLSTSQFTNPGCSTYSSTNICIACLDRYFLSFGFCMPVTPLCFTYDKNNGNCLSCYEGFALTGVACSLIPIPNCIQSSLLNGCIQCELNYTLFNKKCYKNVAFCLRYDFVGKTCQQCLKGYAKADQECKLLPIENCINQVATQCRECNSAFILSNSICHKKDPQCLLYENLACLFCSQGFQLLNNSCLQMIQYCKKYDSSRNCIQCQVDFKVNKGICIVNENIEPFEQFCRQFNETSCVKCSVGYYLDVEGHCTQIDQYCKTFNYTTNLCQECYTGYAIEANQCVISLLKLDPNCQTFVKNICIKCSNGFAFDKLGKCLLLDQHCKTFNDQFKCTQCYLGYMVDNETGLCIISSNKYCLTWGNGACIKCTPDSYLQDGGCTLIDQYCSTFNFTTSKCISCYLGYILSQDQTKCNLLISMNTNFNCALFNSAYVCVKCYNGYFVKNGNCQLADQTCRTYNQSNGFCTKCYIGYYLQRVTGRCRRF